MANFSNLSLRFLKRSCSTKSTRCELNQYFGISVTTIPMIMCCPRTPFHSESFHSVIWQWQFGHLWAWMMSARAVLSHLRFWKGICEVAGWIGLKILIPKHPWKSKIGLLQTILAAKRYVSFFLGHPVVLPKLEISCWRWLRWLRWLRWWWNIYLLSSISQSRSSSVTRRVALLCTTIAIQYPPFYNLIIIINIFIIIIMQVSSGEICGHYQSSQIFVRIVAGMTSTEEAVWSPLTQSAPP